jgi:hypothetical protein
MIEALFSSELSVLTRATRRYIPGYFILHDNGFIPALAGYVKTQHYTTEDVLIRK